MNLDAQGHLWGVTTAGGPDGAGVIFKTDGDGTGYSVVKNFSIAYSGESPGYTRLIETSAGKLYGMTQIGGVHNQGLIFEYDPISGNYIDKVDFESMSKGSFPFGGLVLAANGKLYGMATHGGNNDKGVLFEFDLSNGTYTKKLDFDSGPSGALPYGSLIQASDGNLYGLTSEGGANGYGVLFKFDPVGGTYSKLLDFLSATNGANPIGDLVESANGKLYGMTFQGGAHGAGVLFEYNPSNGDFTDKIDFEPASTGASPNGSLIQATNGKLYGMASMGGVNGIGVLFEFDPSSGGYVKKFDLQSDGGCSPRGSLVQAVNGKLYGMTIACGAGGLGTLFEYDLINSSFEDKVDFDNTNTGARPYGSLMQASDGKLYGMISGGGVNVAGVLFAFDVSNGKYAKQFDFKSAPEGAHLYGSLVGAPNGKLYGTTREGGVHGVGVLFECDPSNGTYVKKFDFNYPNNGANPVGGLTLAGNGKLYGTTTIGGQYLYGILFEYDPSNDVWVKKVDLDYSISGAYPAGLTLASNGKLYGLNSSGGNGFGVLFEYDPANGSIAKKMDFQFGISGSNPYGNLLMADNGKLYGMTYQGGAHSAGVLFEYDPSIEGYVNKFDFQSTSGANPRGSLVQATNGKLYGMTSKGGVNDVGALFEYDPTNGNYVKKLDFESTSSGANPYGALSESVNGKLYGMTRLGGAHGKGVLFEFDPSNSNFIKRVDLDEALGIYPENTSLFFESIPQNIVFNALPTKTLGDAPFSLTATSGSGLSVNYATPSDRISISGSQVTIVAAGRVTITASQPGNNFYLPSSSVDQSFCIRPAQPVVTISNANPAAPLLTSNAPGGNQWYLDGVPIPGETSGTLTATSSGTYKVQAAVDDCVSDFSADAPLVVTGESSTMSSRIEIYPNPAENYLLIRGLNDVGDAQLYDMIGRTCSLVLEKGEGGYRAPVHQLTQGVYLLRVQSGFIVHQIKFIKQ